MLQALLGMVLRHGLTLLAGLLINKGLVDASGAEAITGGLMAAAGIGLSALNKVKVVAKINAAADSFKGLNE